MTKQDAQFYGSIAVCLPAIWAGAYLFHINPLGSVFDTWWTFPWYVTVLAIVASIPLLFSITAGIIWKNV